MTGAEYTEVREAVVVRPGDTLIVRVDRNMPTTEMQEFKARAEERLPGVQVVVIRAEQLMVYRPDGGDRDG